MSSPTSAMVLLTDFGLSDPFVGVMKGVLLGRAPGVPVVDLTHGIAPQDVRQAAFALLEAVPYFPEGSLFVCVVDPGVGSGRRILWARGDRHQFLAPDNGLLSWVGRRERLRELRAVTRSALFLKPLSRTFHGRDVFAPVAAALARGAAPESLGPRVPSLKRLAFPAPRRAGGKVRGEILAIDRFGNAITSLTPRDLPPRARLRHRGVALGPLRTHYAQARAGGLVALTGSSGHVELSVRGGSFARVAGARVGDPIEGVTHGR
ncbi:MAG: SAM-dependent chlorinase/fluorinase [Elusimicrobia bacterium]|nr:SAM-dependent chlorinase/fluorinase [Elusimicrobiota bacterium]